MKRIMGLTLARALALSSLMVVLFLPAGARAHEVMPAVADLTAGGGSAELALQINAEAHLAGINLDGISNTNDAPEAARYDALRAQTPDALAQQVRAEWAAMLAGLTLQADGATLPLALADVTVEAQQDPELARVTRLVLRAPLAERVRALTLEWPAGQGALILRQQGVAEPFTGYLQGGARSPEILLAGTPPASAAQTLGSYIPVGFDHILPKGLDHILFVLGLFFLGTRFVPLLWQVSAFTLAHTVTLALGVLGWVNVPGSIVEPLIAASIVYVAVENVFARGLPRWRPVVIFAFGLLHGLGFASVLAEFGLPQGQVVPALIGFNIGVELGQLAVIAMAAFCVAPALRLMGSGATEAARRALGYAGIGYGGAAVVLAGLGLALNGPQFEAAMGAGAPVFLWPVAALCAACALALRAPALAPKLAPALTGTEAYRRFVSIPASLAIAAVGAMWVLERTVLA